MKINSEILFYLYKYLYLNPRGLFEFKNERLSIKRNLKINTKLQSIIFFTTHKCASKFFHQFFKDITKQSDFKKFNFDEFKLRYEKYSSYEEIYHDYANDKGGIYAPIRRFQKFKNLNNYKVILALRDPRDTLVSYYYSTLYSHDTNSVNFIRHKNKFKNSKIDSFVIENSDWLLNIFEQYIANLNTYHYINYEKLISFPSETLQSLLRYIEIDISEIRIAEYVKNLTPSGSNENLSQHKRSGLSGQYVKHLSPKTITYLNNKFKHIIDYYDFKL